MSESIFCEDCGKTLMQARGEYDHGCLDCAGSIQSEKLFWLRKEVKELKAKIQLQEQRIENLLKALEKSVSAGEFFSRYADCKSDSWACRCPFCKDVNSSKNLREAR